MTKNVRSVVDWFQRSGWEKAPWIMAGKGPSFDRRGEVEKDLAFSPVLGLNHVCAIISCRVAHFTDLEAYRDCASHLANQDGMVAMPWRPHQNNRTGADSLVDLIKSEKSIGDLFQSDRLLAYNSSQCYIKKSSLPTITVRYFSAVAGLDILAAAGVRHVRTIGIDGGSSYSKDFDKKTLLSNGRDSFDAQFGEMAKIVKKHRMDLSPLLRD